MEQKLSHFLADNRPTIHHIGSTAIRGIHAKSVIDVLVELGTAEGLYNSAELLSRNGFRTMSRENKRISMNFGYTESGFAESISSPVRMASVSAPLRFCNDKIDLEGNRKEPTTRYGTRP